MAQEIAVYVFGGFLDAGKTTFINESALSDEEFLQEGPILILQCEEGEEEYDVEALRKKGVFVENFASPEELTKDNLEDLQVMHHARVVILEYNGMWQLNDFYNNMPEGWFVYQQVCIADATTILGYNANMRQLVVDKLQGSSFVIFNHFTKEMDMMEYHKLVRAIGRRTNIAYAYVDGHIENDTIVDPLPYDINAPVIKVSDDDFAYWYRDITEEPKKYNGKVIELKAKCGIDDSLPKGTFVLGRQIMICCAQDIQFYSLIAQGRPSEMPVSGKWYKARFKVAFKYNKVYREKGPVLYVSALEKADPPEDEVATF